MNNQSVRDNAIRQLESLTLKQCRARCIRTKCFAIDYDMSGEHEHSCAIMQDEPPQPWEWVEVPFLDFHRFIGCFGEYIVFITLNYPRNRKVSLCCINVCDIVIVILDNEYYNVYCIRPRCLLAA